ncbi:helix-turn-helix domain-containing protein [Methylobacterium currus]|uniref:XRE family transcriptional regulator n=1 Tax=Methylobacterium currus TaxID=2051553 RepID=UPI001E4F18E5|nr:helix-turn-helix domain-containing protein [Methylobacterium currus]UHC16039.1 helix-turn-helix domain-containing protein [Methylobacterium currus]
MAFQIAPCVTPQAAPSLASEPRMVMAAWMRCPTLMATSMTTVVFGSQVPKQGSATTTEVVGSSLMDWQDRITEGRKAKGLSQAALAKLADVSQATIAKIESKKAYSSEFLSKIIDALNLNAADFPDSAFEVKRGGKPARDDRQLIPEFAKDPAYWAHAAGLIGDVPLYAAAEGGEGNLYLDREQIGTVQRPPLLQGVKDGYAIYLSGESMSPEFEPGDILLVNPRLPAISGNPCVFYSTHEDGVRILAKRLISSSSSAWRVKQHNPIKEFDLLKSEWAICHRIISKNFR